MIECNTNNLVKYYGSTKIFENISFELQSEDRVGLIGLNGSGKTTLMKILMGIEEYQEGTVSFRKGTKVGYLDQIFHCEPHTTVIQILEESFKDIWDIRTKIRILEESLKELSASDLDIQMKNYSTLLEEFELIGGYHVETNINKVCTGLLIPDEFRDKPFYNLSGGEKTRVLLAKLLLEEPDILLLDEPTNHLDIKSIEWLEDFIIGYKGTVLMVSHDRSFLDKVATRIMELEPHGMNLYDGNYSYYVVEKEIRFEIEYKSYLNNQRKIEQMERQIERYRIWGAARDSEKMYKRAKELEKRLDRVDVLDRPSIENSKIRLSLSGISRSGKIVIHAENLSKSFGVKKLFKDLSFTLFYKDRLCIMGENGSGKSTLLQIILGYIDPDGGKFTLGSSLTIGHLPQNVVFDNEELSILEYFSSKHNLFQSEARTELAKMLFIRDDVFKKIKSLSGGEKSRLKLASLIYDKVNLMILDEPTNHLDIDSREILEDSLSKYNGTILFVSHDRYFVKRIATKIMILNKSHYKLYEVPYEEYLIIKEKELVTKPLTTEVKKVKIEPEKPIRKPNNTFKITKIEEEIDELENTLNIINEEMNLYSDDAEKLHKLFIEKEALENKIQNSYEIWEGLQV